MCFDVISEIMCVWRRKIALCAIVWLLPTVNEHVPLQITSSAKGLSALLTAVYFLPTVGDHVPPQDLWHWTQAYVLSLLWVNMSIFKWPAWPKDFWHSEHLCILSPLGAGKWFTILLWFDVDREHSAPRCSPIWMIWTLPSALHRSLKTLICLIEWNMIQVRVSDRW